MKAIIHAHDLNTNDYIGQFEIENDDLAFDMMDQFLKSRTKLQKLKELRDIFKNELEEQFDEMKFSVSLGATHTMGMTKIIQIYTRYTDYENYRDWETNYSFTVIKTK